MALFEPIFEALNAAGVRYVVVGGVAVVLHGHARMTADLDLAVDLSPRAAADAVSALVGIGFRPRVPVDALDFANASARARWAEQQGMVVFSLWDPHNPMRSVDLFVENPIDFDELWANSEDVDLGTTSTHVASIRDLIRLKQISGRPQDIADIEVLEAILAREEEG